MGSSHSAPRRILRRSPRVSETELNSASFHGDNSSEYQMPSLLEEGSNSGHDGRDEGGASTQESSEKSNDDSATSLDATTEAPQVMSDSRVDKMSGLAVIQSTRALNSEEMDVVSGHNSTSCSRRVPNDNMDESDSSHNHNTTQNATEVSGNSESNSIDSDVSTYATSSCMDDASEMESLTPSSGSGSVPDFLPQGSRNSEWMGRSLETLILGYTSVIPILCLPEDEDEHADDLSFWGPTRRRSTVSTLGSEYGGRRSSLGSLPGNRRGSLGNGQIHGGTLASYHHRRRGADSSSHSRRGSAAGMNRRGSAAGVHRRGSASHGPSYRRRLSLNRNNGHEQVRATGGPNIALTLIAREATGRRISRNPMPASKHLRAMGGHSLFSALDRPAGGMCSEVAFLSEVIDSGDWAETQTVISRISPRLIGDPSTAAQESRGDRNANIVDPNLPPTASSFYAGGGRLGLERDTFVQAGGVDVLIRIFREPSFVGAEMARMYDARDLSEELVAIRLAPCWNEALACFRELVYTMPSLVENGDIFDNGDFLPFLFTLLSHDSCFDGAAALIEEILSLQSHSSPQPSPEDENQAESLSGYQASERISLPTTFFLGNVPNLYKLWGGFNCRQLAHFCRIIALLVFEPEDRQLLESPAVLKSIELLQLRRNRAARAGRDSTVDMNQAILLGDENLTRRLLKLLTVMNFAPSLRRTSPYQVMAHFPFIADTLIMLGLNEIEKWNEIDRLENLARKMTTQGEDNGEIQNPKQLNELGSVADMLESLSSTLMANQGEAATNQLGHIIHVISAAQHAGVVVGSAHRRRQAQDGEGQGNESNRNSSAPVARPVPDRNAVDGLASATGVPTDQILARRFYSQSIEEDNSSTNEAGAEVSPISIPHRDSISGLSSSRQRPLVNTPEDAANALQFNALLLGPYQVEVLFVLCTLLGGRRKIDTQEILNKFGVISILDDMFQRLPWDSLSPTRQSTSARSQEGQNNGAADPGTDQANELHGPGCECTPESALCVQYLRLLHNFCDRDCDNYAGRRLLLSDVERDYIFENNDNGKESDIAKLRPGLLSKVIAAFIGESDESPYRFWLASCVESYLRGSSPVEQGFVAKSGLLKYLSKDISSERFHSAGSLQTSFDLLGELCKGNAEVIHLLVKDLDEESFRKLMSVAAANLVDSNVFIRSLLLSLERMSSLDRMMPLHLNPEYFTTRQGKWRSHNGVFSRAYLTHSWWDTHLVNFADTTDQDSEKESGTSNERICDVLLSSDWFPTIGTIKAYKMRPPGTIQLSSSGLHDGVGHFGWVFTPVGEALCDAAHEPNTIERLSWFLAVNQTRLLRDLLGVVDLRNINHENICCLNTAVMITIFAYRREELHCLLQELGRLNIEERDAKRRALKAVRKDDVVDRAFVQAMKYMELDYEIPTAQYARRSSVSTSRRASLSMSRRASLTYYGTNNEIGDRNDVMRNFREVLWFWMEYYTHRGRDRLSLEFSSHLRFQEWIEVVSLLGADNGSSTSLVQNPVRLPRSPYQSAARVPESLNGL